MNFLVPVTAVALCALALEGAPAAATKKAPAARRSSASARVTAKRRSRSRKSATARRGPARQLAPTPERYKEIQKALADRGYLKTEPNGVWDAASQDAMRAFQTDQKLEPTGKLTAASLIALGLGPNQNTVAQAAPSSAAQPTSQPSTFSPPATVPGTPPTKSAP